MRIERTDQRFIAKSSVLLVPYMLHRNCLGGAIPSIGEEEVVGVHGRLGWQREDLFGGAAWKQTSQESWEKEERPQSSEWHVRLGD